MREQLALRIPHERRRPSPDGDRGGAQGDDAYLQLTVRDGDDFFGERCELGHNDHRDGPTAIYREGDRRVTFASYRLPQGATRSRASGWQVVMQIKQSAPSANSGGTPGAGAGGQAWPLERLLNSRTPRGGPELGFARGCGRPRGRDRHLDQVCLRRGLLEEEGGQGPDPRLVADLNGDGGGEDDAADSGGEAQTRSSRPTR